MNAIEFINIASLNCIPTAISIGLKGFLKENLLANKVYLQTCKDHVWHGLRRADGP